MVTYICSVWESLPCEEDPWSRPGSPLCHEGSSTHHYDHHDYHRHHHCSHLLVVKIRKISLSRRCRILISAQVLKKANIVQKKKTTEHTRTERQVLRLNQIFRSMKPVTRGTRRTKSEHATREPISNAFPEILILLFMRYDRK